MDNFRIFAIKILLKSMNGLSFELGTFEPLFSRIIFRKVLKVIIFRVVLCNHPKDVHVLRVLSEVVFSPNLFVGPLFLNYLDLPT